MVPRRVAVRLSGPVGIRPVTSLALVLGCALLLGPEARAQSAHPAYYGGAVVSNPAVVLVSYGNVDATTANGMPSFYSTILQSPYLDWVSEYSTVGLTGLTDGLAGSNQRIGRGTVVGSYSLMALPGPTVSNTQILQQLQAEIGLGNLPAPTVDAEGNPNTVYMVNLAPGLTLLSYGGTSSCAAPPTGFCGTTDSMVVGSLNVGVGFVADQSTGSPCTGLCGADSNYFNNATEVHAHVLLNLITNAEYGAWNAAGTGTVARPIAWYNVGAEHQVADICTGQRAEVGGFYVETGWSNLQEACVSEAATPLAICTGATTYCRQCGLEDVDGGCPGATPACELEATNISFGECVACTDSTECSGTTPVCAKGGTANDTCRACSGDGECTTSAAGTHCLSSGACGPQAAPAASSSGCNASGGSTGTLAGLLALLLFFLRRPARALARTSEEPAGSGPGLRFQRVAGQGLARVQPGSPGLGHKARPFGGCLFGGVPGATRVPLGRKH